MQAITLTFEELLLIDGKVNPEAQRVIDSAKETYLVQTTSGLIESEARMVQKIVESSRKELRLDYHAQPIKTCPCCARNEGYWPVRRTSRYKRRGDPDRDNPKTFCGYSINPGFISIKHYISLGFCDSCKDRVLPHILGALKDDQVYINPKLSGEPSRFIRHRNRKCKKCGWTGHDGEMIWATTLIGDGKYPAYCPSCKTGGLFNNDVELADGYSVIPA